VHHEKVLVGCEAPDFVDELELLVKPAGVRMEEDRVVLIPFRRLYVNLRHLAAMETALGFAHLIPLIVGSLARMHLSEGFHREVEDELKVRHAAGEGATFESGDESFAGCHK
jgi:hypothetical protein